MIYCKYLHSIPCVLINIYFGMVKNFGILANKFPLKLGSKPQILSLGKRAQYNTIVISGNLGLTLKASTRYMYSVI